MKNIIYFFKLNLYRFLNTPVGKSFLRILKPFVYVKNLEKSNKIKKYPFIVTITVDTEAGHVQKNEYRLWQGRKPDAFIGFYKGIENWTNLFNSYKVKSTFFLSTQCFDAESKESHKIKTALKNLAEQGNEIGLHLHPDSDFALQKYLKNNFRYTAAKFYDYKNILAMISGSKHLIKENLGYAVADKIVSVRWGNWALNSTAVAALKDAGFKIDSSAVPGLRGHLREHREYDWSKVKKHYPWYLSSVNHQSVNSEKSELLEVPIATFNLLGFKLRADPVNISLLNYAFEYYYNNADRSEKPFIFVVMTHSSESTYEDGSKTLVVDTMEDFIRTAKKQSDVKFLPLNEAYQLTMEE